MYRARDTVLGRDVAIKALLSELGDDSRQRQRFLSEARAAAALDHPFICKIFGIEDVGDATLIVMELIEGETLADRIQRGPRQPSLHEVREMPRLERDDGLKPHH